MTTSAFSSSHSIQPFRYADPLATVDESPTTQRCRFALVMATAQTERGEISARTLLRAAGLTIQATLLCQEADLSLRVAPDEADDDDLALLPLQAIDGADERLWELSLDNLG